MSGIISCGKVNHYYKYFLLSTIFLFLNYIAFGINYNESFVELKLFPGKKINESKKQNDTNFLPNNNTFNKENQYYELTIFKDSSIYTPEQRQPYFSKHKYIHFIFCYFFTFILGIIYYFIDKKRNQRSSNVSNGKKEKSANTYSSIKLIHKDPETLYFSTRTVLNLLFIIFLWVIMDFFMYFYTNTLKDLDFWFFELLLVSIFSSKTLNLKLYSHQKLAIFFNSTLCLTKIAPIILSFRDGNSKEYLWYTEDAFYKMFFGIIIYFCLISIRSYVNTQIKVYIDLKYVSTTKLLILYGFFGTIIYTIICLITTFFKCSSSSIFSKSDLSSNYICNVPFKNTIDFDKVQKDLTENGNLYLDNFVIYYKTFINSDYKEMIKEIIIILLAGISYFYYKYFCLMIIKFLSPIHYIFSNQIYFCLKKIVLPIYTFINEGSFFY